MLKCGSKYSVAVQLSQRCETWEGVAGDRCDLVVVEVPEMERKKVKHDGVRNMRKRAKRHAHDKPRTTKANESHTKRHCRSDKGCNTVRL